VIDQAIAFAAIAHAGQKRKYTGDPYIVHPLEVMSIVRTVEPDREDMAVAAVLHDVVEDTPVTLREIERRFGADIGFMVKELTDVAIEGNRAMRKAADRARLAAAPYEVQTIKVADLISNTSTIVQFDPKFAKTYLEEKRLLLEVLTEAHAHLIWQAQARLSSVQLTPA